MPRLPTLLALVMLTLTSCGLVGVPPGTSDRPASATAGNGPLPPDQVADTGPLPARAASDSVPAPTPAAPPAAPLPLSVPVPKPTDVRLTLYTGGKEGVYEAYGKALERIWYDADIGTVVVTAATSGTTENLQQLGAGRADLAFAQADAVAAAAAGTDPFRGPMAVQAVAALYPEYLHLVAGVDAGISRVADLSGRRVGLGPRGSNSARVARWLMGAANSPESAVTAIEASYDEMASAFAAGELDAFVIISGTPNPLLASLAERRPFMLVPVGPDEAAALTARNAGLLAATIPAGAYAAADPSVPTVSAEALLVARPSTDPNVIYWLTRTLFEERARMEVVYPPAAPLDPARAVRVAPAALHPGAKRYFDEVGAGP